ncbi:MAG TPA: chemotaxis protein CheW [Ktedonobacterales bacterium]
MSGEAQRGPDMMDGQASAVDALDSVMVGQDAAAPDQDEPQDEPGGEQYLLFWLGDWPCLVRLAELREALPHVPRHVALPFSPRWLWGIFPLRTDLVALVDPIPMLTLGPETARDADATRRAGAAPLGVFGQVEPLRALVVGEGDHLLALLADRIDEIRVVRAEDQCPLDQPPSPSDAPLPRYIAESYTVEGLERPALALRVSHLVEDVLAALEEQTDDE